jgi:hypothetical protein
LEGGRTERAQLGGERVLYNRYPHTAGGTFAEAVVYLLAVVEVRVLNWIVGSGAHPVASGGGGAVDIGRMEVGGRRREGSMSSGNTMMDTTIDS